LLVAGLPLRRCRVQGEAVGAGNLSRFIRDVSSLDRGICPK
jgi:hypothetical protein